MRRLLESLGCLVLFVLLLALVFFMFALYVVAIIGAGRAIVSGFRALRKLKERRREIEADILKGVIDYESKEYKKLRKDELEAKIMIGSGSVGLALLIALGIWCVCDTIERNALARSREYKESECMKMITIGRLYLSEIGRYRAKAREYDERIEALRKRLEKYKSGEWGTFHIKLYEGFIKTERERIKNVLDKEARGEELSYDEKWLKEFTLKSIEDNQRKLDEAEKDYLNEMKLIESEIEDCLKRKERLLRRVELINRILAEKYNIRLNNEKGDWEKVDEEREVGENVRDESNKEGIDIAKLDEEFKRDIEELDKMDKE